MVSCSPGEAPTNESSVEAFAPSELSGTARLTCYSCTSERDIKCTGCGVAGKSLNGVLLDFSNKKDVFLYDPVKISYQSSYLIMEDPYGTTVQARLSQLRGMSSVDEVIQFFQGCNCGGAGTEEDLIALAALADTASNIRTDISIGFTDLRVEMLDSMMSKEIYLDSVYLDSDTVEFKMNNDTIHKLLFDCIDTYIDTGYFENDTLVLNLNNGDSLEIEIPSTPPVTQGAIMKRDNSGQTLNFTGNNIVDFQDIVSDTYTSPGAGANTTTDEIVINEEGFYGVFARMDLSNTGALGQITIIGLPVTPITNHDIRNVSNPDATGSLITYSVEISAYVYLQAGDTANLQVLITFGPGATGSNSGGEAALSVIKL